jgi:hypothetical protein
LPVESVGLVPEGEGLRLAIAWLAARPERSLELIEEASQRFALSPLEAAVLFRYFSLAADSLYQPDQ